MPLTRRQVWLLATGFWTVFAVVCAIQVWTSMITHGHSFARLLVYHVVVWDAWIVLGWAAARLALRVPLAPPRLRNTLVHLLAGCLIGLSHAAWWVACMLVLRPFDRMNPTDFAVPFLSLAFRHLPLEIVLYGLIVFGAHASQYYEESRDRATAAANLERSLAQARLNALELQIQPHFLFNTLNSVSALVRTGRPDEAVATVAGLSDLLRYALDRAGNQRVTVAEETDMLRRYLEIQRLRFADRLSFDIEVAAEARNAAVPVLLLQPLAENAIRHGVARSAGPGRVHLRAYRRDGSLRIEMSNTGRLAADAVRGIGLSNTVARLEELYGEGQRFDLRESAEGVTAEVTIPWSVVA
jgi:hypothetical protein